MVSGKGVVLWHSAPQSAPPSPKTGIRKVLACRACLTPVSSQAPVQGPPSACRQCLEVVFLALRLAELSLKEGRCRRLSYLQWWPLDGADLLRKSCQCLLPVASGPWHGPPHLFKSAQSYGGPGLGSEGQYFPLPRGAIGVLMAPGSLSVFG